MKKLLIIDDERTICSSLKFTFENEYEVYTATNMLQVEESLASVDIDIALIDLRFGNICGLDILRKVKSVDTNIVAIMMTAFGSIESSIKAMKMGAYDYITKPLDMTKLKVLLLKAVEYKNLNEKINYLEKEIDTKYGCQSIIGKSKKIQELFHIINKIKDNDANVLIQGGSGTGKELVARAIHFQGKRKKFPFEALNCGAIPSNLIESELFGYEKGAFTGATQKRKGRFEVANGGTIFLDEIGEMDLNLQVKLLRVLEEKKVFPIGGEEGRKIDVRIIAATNRDLKKEVEKGNFREDLYFRLNVVQIKTPGLNERKEATYVYTLIKVSEDMTNLIVDAAVGEEADEYGEEYEMEPQFLAAFNGIPAYAIHTWEDPWYGVQKSAFAPIYNTKGEIVAILGVDYPAPELASLSK